MLKFKIQICQEGLRDCFSSGQGDWGKYIPDLRTNMQSLSITVSEEAPLTVLIPSEYGYYIGVLKLMKGSRAGDHVAAWLLIPNDVTISGEDLEEKVKQLQNILQGSSLEGKNEEFLQLCKGGSKKRLGVQFERSSDAATRQNAYRNYASSGTPYSLREILNDLNQKEYPQYGVIFLLGGTKAITIPGMTNLTSEPIIKYVNISSPNIPSGYKVLTKREKACTNTYTEVTTDILQFEEGDRIDVKVEREGFELIEKPKITLDELERLSVERLEWKRRIIKSHFKVTSADKDMNYFQCQIRINGEVLKDNGILLSEAELNNVSLEFESDGYDKERSSQYSLKGVSNTNPIRVKLSRSVEEHTFSIPIDLSCSNSLKISNLDIRIPKRGRFRKSPIKGYKIGRAPGSKDYLDFDAFYIFKKKGTIVVLVLSLLSFFGLGWFLGNSYSPKVEDSIPETRTINNGSKKTPKKESSVVNDPHKDSNLPSNAVDSQSNSSDTSPAELSNEAEMGKVEKPTN